MCKSQKVATFLVKRRTINKPLPDQNSWNNPFPDSTLIPRQERHKQFLPAIRYIGTVLQQFHKVWVSKFDFFSTMKQLDAHVGLSIYRTIFETIFFSEFFLLLTRLKRWNTFYIYIYS